MSKRLIIDMDCGNAAFEDASGGPEADAEARRMECARILREAAKKLELGHSDFDLRDLNGNFVGKLRFINGRK